MLEHMGLSLPKSGLGLSSCTWWDAALLAAAVFGLYVCGLSCCG